MNYRSGRAKGSILVHLRKFVVERRGEAAWITLLDEMTPEDRDLLGGLVIVGGWYPVTVWNHALSRFLPRHYPLPDEGMRELAAYIADEDLSRVYKMILRMGTPEFLLKRTGSLWSRYFDTGALSSAEVEPKRWRLSLDAPADESAAPDYYTCGPGVCAWIRLGLKRTGVEADVRHERCRFHRGPSCEYHVTW